MFLWMRPRTKELIILWTYASCQYHLLLFEYAIRVEEWNDSIQEEGAGGLDFHLGH